MKKEFITAFIISFVFLSLGFALLHFELIGYGMSIFVFLPFILGYVLGSSVVKKVSLWGLIFSLGTFFALLYAGFLEGMVCILMSLPLVVAAVSLGIIAKRYIDKYILKKAEKDKVKSSILPFFLFFGLGLVEKELTRNDMEIISVKTEMTLPYSASEVYETIKSVDTLIAEKPFLMKLDLPIPNKCILEKEEVGGLRTCYFSGGTITERITELEKAKVLKMDVIDYKLTGRKWLGFKEAIYYFDQIGKDSSKITRITTYTSVLTPRFYWQPLEKIGISQEHQYVFDNLKNDLKKKFGNR
jgi:hypothetical protein